MARKKVRASLLLVAGGGALGVIVSEVVSARAEQLSLLDPLKSYKDEAALLGFALLCLVGRRWFGPNASILLTSFAVGSGVNIVRHAIQGYRK